MSQPEPRQNEQPRRTGQPGRTGQQASLRSASLPSALAVSRIFPMLVVIGAVAFSFMWRSAEFRLQVVDRLGGYELFSLEAALEDPDAEVAVRVCRYLVSNERLSSEGVDTLYRRPDVALACLGRIKVDELEDQRREQLKRSVQQGRAPARSEDPTLRREVELVSSWQIVATQLARRWMSDVLEGKGDVCTKAKHARLALDHGGADQDYPMMSCVVLAESETARTCCMEELGGEERFELLLGEAGGPSLPSLGRDLPALVEASFAPELAGGAGKESKKEKKKESKEAKEKDEQSQDEQSQDEQSQDEQSQDEQIRRTEDVQDWVFELGCRVHYDQPRERRVVEAFQEVIEADHCAPTEVPWPGFYDMHNWLQICAQTYWEHRLIHQSSPTEAICESLEDTSIDQSITATQRGLAAALIEARLYARSHDFTFGNYIDPQFRQFVPVYPGQWY